MMEVDEPSTEQNDVQQIRIRPNRILLNPNFDKYILSTQHIPLFKKIFDQKVQVDEPSNAQWSRHELKLFNLINPLVLDLYHSGSSISSFIFLNNDKNVVRLCYNYDNLTFNECQSITLNPPLINPEKTSENSLPVSFLIGSEKFIFVCNGHGNLSLYKLDINGLTEEWTMIAGFTLKEDSYELQEGCNDTGVPFILGDVRKVNDTRFELALLSVYKQSEEHRKGGSVFANAIYWISLEILDTCKVVHSRCYHTAGNLEFVTFSTAGDEIIILTAKEPQIVFDSNNEIKSKDVNVKEKSAPIYTWSQSHDEITITFNLNALTAKDDIKVTFQINHISVANKDLKLLEGNLFGEIVPDECTWTIQKINDNTAIHSLLEITLHKKVPTAWLHLVPTDQHGEETINGEAVDVKPLHDQVAPTSVNPDQLEEVDEDNDEVNFLFWINDMKQGVVRMANLSFHKLIFVQQFHPNKPLDICIREDVDGVVYSLDNTNESKLEHYLTLDAFGYIQAGKSSRRFSTCAPDGSYSAIVDGRNHAYIYLKASTVSDTELRNTKTRKAVPTIARQQVVSLASFDPEYSSSLRNSNIIFTAAREKVFFLATNWAIYACHVN
uniref:NudC domain-containing protein 1 n=1 Tax=Panagrolaimus superbus TaxID=310955 RepID=A0A914YVP7_9BILA